MFSIRLRLLPDFSNKMFVLIQLLFLQDLWLIEWKSLLWLRGGLSNCDFFLLILSLLVLEESVEWFFISGAL